MPSHAVALLGRDYPTLGPLGAIQLPGGGALALSRGEQPKPYRHVDPNEDAALIVRDRRGVLLAVADGHNGVEASERSIEAVREQASYLLVADSELFQERVTDCVHTLCEGLGAVGASRSCLLIVSLVDAHCCWSCLGDSSLFRGSVSEPVSFENRRVIGPELRLDDSLAEEAFGHFVRFRGERVALVTDGVTNFVKSDTVPTLIAGDLDDGECAREIGRSAMRMGAGDNLAVAIFSGPV